MQTWFYEDKTIIGKKDNRIIGCEARRIKR
jgi:hypothetical protein